jgi:hypothetical protein
MFEQAEVRYVFDEARALIAIKEAVRVRDVAGAAKADAIIEIGKLFIAARKQWPGERNKNGTEAYSPRFLAFIEKAGLALSTAQGYMVYARKPASLEAARAGHSNRATILRARVLREIHAALLEGTKEEVIAAIEEMLNEKANS